MLGCIRERFFPGVNWHFEPVFRWRKGAAPVGIVGAVWIVGIIKVHQDLAAMQGQHVQVASRTIGFMPAGSIGEGQEVEERPMAAATMGLPPTSQPRSGGLHRLPPSLESAALPKEAARAVVLGTA